MPFRKLNTATDFGLHVGIAAALFATTPLFYSTCNPIHQDLARRALSGHPAVSYDVSTIRFTYYARAN